MKKFSQKAVLIFWFILYLIQSAIAINPGTPKAVRYLHPVFEKTEVQKDIVFDEVTNFEGKNEKLLLDVYSPEGDNEAGRPVILWLHGGGFRPGNDKTQSYIVKMSTEFAKRGYVCVSVNYRLRQNPKDDKAGTISDALKDAMSGLNWIRKNDQKLKIEPKKIIVGGGSAGGMLAVNFCYKDNSVKAKWDKSGIIGLIDLWGSPDESYMFSTIGKNDPPTIIVHGTADKLVPYENSVQLAKQLEINQVKHELITIEGAEHTPVSHFDDFIEKIAGFIYALHVKV
jgi:acetyl esterase/lipase